MPVRGRGCPPGHLAVAGPQSHSACSRLALLVAASAALQWPYASATGAASSTPSASLTGFPQFVYDFETSHCPALPQPGCNTSIQLHCDADVPDAPTRGFWNGTDLVLLASVDLGSRANIGPSPSALAHDCSVYAVSALDARMSQYAPHEWPHSTWYFPSNNSVYALSHLEYHNDGNFNASWGPYSFFSGVSLFASLDGGRTFSHARPPPSHIVAVSPVLWNTTIADNAWRLGFRSPSGLVQSRGGAPGDSGWFYATVTALWGSDRFNQQAGPCVMRTRDVTDPSAWRAWGGSAFNVSLDADPFAAPVDPLMHACVPIEGCNMTYATLAWSTVYSRYMMFGTHNGSDAAGWGFLLSDDLVHWDTWTAVDVGGFIDPAGNASIVAPAPGAVPGRFISRQGGGGDGGGGGGGDGGGAVWWEDPTGTFKAPVGSCTPCPAVDACSGVVPLAPAAFDALANASDAFSCGLVYNVSGYEAFYYPTILDESVGPRRPNYDEVGPNATLFLVGQRCVNVSPSPGGGGGGAMACSPFTPQHRILERDILRVPISFGFAQAGGGGGR